MPGKVLLVCGGRGTGKTTLLKELCGPVHPSALMIFDPAQQHKELYPKPFIKFDAFTQVVKNIHNGVIAFEEATIYLSNRGYDSDIVDLLVQSNQHGNTAILVYHSLASIPVYIYNLSDGIFLKRTNDAERKVDSRFDSEPLNNGFKKINSQGNKYAHIYIPINAI